jgi:hypothetical protein
MTVVLRYLLSVFFTLPVLIFHKSIISNFIVYFFFFAGSKYVFNYFALINPRSIGKEFEEPASEPAKNI